MHYAKMAQEKASHYAKMAQPNEKSRAPKSATHHRNHYIMGDGSMASNTFPEAIQMQVRGIVRDYDRVRREYMTLRRAILDAGGVDYATTRGNRDRRCLSRPVEGIEIKLEALERYQAFRQMHAVEHALDAVTKAFPGEMAVLLKTALMVNTCGGREFPFERLNVVGVSRSGFYLLRRQFYKAIAEELEIIV